ncbi:hypothetical protein H4R35_003898 [Dimargaris xerosporica]|nr:hypothetical protein H4R35_003898 [Dimargaris xerosporica]
MRSSAQAADNQGITSYRYSNTGRTSGYYANSTPTPDNRNDDQRTFEVMEPYYNGPLYNSEDSRLPPKYPPAKGSNRNADRKY